MQGRTGEPGADPDRDSDRGLHAALLARDGVAPSDLASTYLQPLADWLRRSYPRADPHLVETAAIDSILNLARRPERYDPSRGGLMTYLRMDARGDLRNTLKAEHRRTAGRVSLGDVAERTLARNASREAGEDPLELVLRGESEAVAVVARLCRELDPPDRAGVELLLDGERRTGAFARALGLEDLPADQQRQAAKRWKDRLRKRLRRRLRKELV